jgi:hypothetical protein
LMQQLEIVVLGQHRLVLRVEALRQASAAGATQEFLPRLASVVGLDGREAHV